MYLTAPAWSSAPNSLGHHFSATGLLPATALPALEARRHMTAMTTHIKVFLLLPMVVPFLQVTALTSPNMPWTPRPHGSSSPSCFQGFSREEVRGIATAIPRHTQGQSPALGQT